MSEDEVLVIGHRNPDADAICSAIAYADFKRRTDLPCALPARCGELTDRVRFILDTFKVAPPKLIDDVAPRIRDVMEPHVVHLTPDATLMDALQVMNEKNIRILPVLRPNGACHGFLSVFKMTKFLCPTADRLPDARRILTSIHHLARTLGAELLVEFDGHTTEELILMIATMSTESFERRVQKFPPEKLSVITGDQPEIQRATVARGVRLLIVTGGLRVKPEIISEAKAAGVSLLVSPHDTATTATYCRAAITVENLVHEHYLAFDESALLSEAQAQAGASHYQAFPVLDTHRRMVGIMTKSDFLKKVRRKLILVDHNELSQAVSGADQLEIIEIIDHHRLGIMPTRHPILFRNEPVGSTSTIVADCFLRHGVELRKPIAGLLLAGLVSDTLNLTSPTSTAKDAEILRQLERITQLRASEFTEKLFASASILASRTASQAIEADCKEFVENGCTFSVAQLEELGFDQFWKREEEIVRALEQQKLERGYQLSALLITDVVAQNSLLVVIGPAGVLRQIDYPMLKPGIYELAGVVSRKKQLLPYLTDCLGQTSTRMVSDEPLTMV